VKRWIQVLLIASVVIVPASGASAPLQPGDPGVVDAPPATVADRTPAPAASTRIPDDPPPPTTRRAAPEPWRFFTAAPAEPRPGSPEIARTAPPAGGLAPVDGGSATVPIELDVPEPKGPLGPLADELPDEVVEVIERIDGESKGGAVRVDAERVRVSLPGLIPSKRDDLADVRGGVYDFNLLRLEFRGLTP
jgi:hypothetical protein